KVRPEPPAAMDPKVLDALFAAAKPLLIAGPAAAHARGKAALREFEEASGIPALVMESPRGVNDPSLGLLAEVLAAADVVLLAGKQKDFTLKFGAAFGKECRVFEAGLPDRSIAWPHRQRGWLDEARSALSFRPAEWRSLTSQSAGPV